MHPKTETTESMILTGASPDKSGEEDSVRLRLMEEPALPLEAEALTPDVMERLSRSEILELPVFQGKRRLKLGDFFEVQGEKSNCLELNGNLANIKLIGRGMTAGRILIHGNAGMHLGAGMSGGTITVHGNAGDWLGAEMSGGLIHLHGSAGGQAGAAYRGSRKGMRGGTILIDGDAGIETAMRMRRGLLCIQGRVGDFAGVQMLGGTIILCGPAGLRTGAWMSRGTIVSLEPVKLLPTFIYACTYEPGFLRLVTNQLHRSGVRNLGPRWNYRVQRYTGDTAGLGKGEILVCAADLQPDCSN